MGTDWGRLADRLSAEATAEGRPTEWFDRLYSAGVAGDVSMPWDRGLPHPLLRDWAERGRVDGSGLSAVVVGCGLGEDAEYVSSLGFDTSAFDISPTAVRLAGERHPGSAVSYRVADLLDLPGEWAAGFDLVIEIYTVQALPDPPRSSAIEGVRSLVAPGGRLLGVAHRYDGTEPLDVGPPYPQTRELFDHLAGDELEIVQVEELDADGPRWRAELRRTQLRGSR